MYILGIETSCDDTSAAVVHDSSEVISMITASQTCEHNKFGGVFPEVASRMHCENISRVVNDAIKTSGVKTKIDAVAVTCKPGLIGSLLVGLNFAKGFALTRKIPIIPVNHLKGHIASLYINNPNLKPPFLCLIVSGGHTCIAKVETYTHFEVLVKTLDDAAGECMDKVARALGLDYPGGKNLDMLAKNGNKFKFSFKTPKLKDYNFSFSGLKTAAKKLICDFKNKDIELPIADICASVQYNIVQYLVNNLFVIAKKNHSDDKKISKIAVSGGVSANSFLRETLKTRCNQEGFEFFEPDLRYCGDNAAMIAVQGYFEFLEGNTGDFSINAKSRCM